METGGFGGVKVSNQAKEKTTTNASQVNSKAGQGNSVDTPSRNDREVARTAVLEPLFFSALFCGVEIFIAFLEPMPEGVGMFSFVLQIISNSIDTFIGYFAATLISMVVFLFLQQYYYNCFAGLDHHRVLFPLGAVFILYFVLFMIYLGNKHLVVKWGMLIFTIVAGITVWRSLREDVQKVEKESGSSNHNPKVFINNDSTSHKSESQG